MLFYSWGDHIQLKKFIDDSNAQDEFKKVQYAKLDRMWQFSSSTDCRTNILLSYFGEFRTSDCGHCDNCLHPPVKFDGKILAQKAISAVIRSSERLTINLLIDVLRGSFKKEVTQLGFQHLKTFGAGRDLSFSQWREYVTQIIDKGLLRIDYVDGFKLKLTPISMDAIKGNVEIQMSQYTESDVDQKKQSQAKKLSAKDLFNRDLLETLKDWRRNESHKRLVPAYVIMTDRTLEHLVEELPVTYNALKDIEGIGDKRYQELGHDIISVIRSYILNQSHKKSVRGKSLVTTLSLFNNGQNPKDIAIQRDVAESTVYSHLIEAYLGGEDFDLSQFVSKEDISNVRAAIEHIEGELNVSLIADALTVPISFNKIRVCLAILQREHDTTMK